MESFQNVSELLENETCDVKTLAGVTDAFRRAKTDKEKMQQIICSENSTEVFTSVCEKVYDNCKVPLQKDGGYFDADDLLKHKNISTEALTFYSVATEFVDELPKVSGIEKNNRDLFKIKVSVYGLLVAAEQSDERCEWSNSETVLAAKQLENNLCCIYKCSGITELLSTIVNGKQMFHYIMEEVKTSSKKHGIKALGTFCAFQYLLGHFNDETLSDYLPVVFPTCLILVDDYRPDNKAKGVTCLRKVLQHCPSSEMKLYRRSTVMYEALHKMLYTNDLGLLSIVLPTMLDVLKVENEIPIWVKTFKKNNEKLHDVVQIILRNMEMENNLNTRRLYSDVLTDYIVALGIEGVLHFRRLFSVIYGYMEVHDGRQEISRINILRALEALITQTWPRIPRYSGEILKNVLKLVVDITDESLVIDEQSVDGILNGCSGCLKLLYLLDQNVVTKTLSAVAQENVSERTVLFCKQRLTVLSEN